MTSRESRRLAHSMAYRLGVTIKRAERGDVVAIIAPEGKTFANGRSIKAYVGWSVESTAEAWEQVVEDLTEGLSDMESKSKSLKIAIQAILDKAEGSAE